MNNERNSKERKIEFKKERKKEREQGKDVRQKTEKKVDKFAERMINEKKGIGHEKKNIRKERKLPLTNLLLNYCQSLEIVLVFHLIFLLLTKHIHLKLLKS